MTMNSLSPKYNPVAAETLYDALASLFPQALVELLGDGIPAEDKVLFQKAMDSVLASPDSRTLNALWRELGQFIDPALLDDLEVLENQEAYREWVWGRLSPRLQEIRRSSVAVAFQEGLKTLIEAFRTHNEDGLSGDETVVTQAEWEATQELLLGEYLGDPEGTLEAFKVKDAFASYGEIQTLFQRTTEPDVAADIVLLLLQVSNRPENLTDLIPNRSLVSWAERLTKMPVKDISAQEDGVKLALEFLRLLASGEVSQYYGVPRLIAAHLRSCYELSKGTKFTIVPLGDFQIEAVFNGYEDLEVRRTLEAIHASAPPAQRQAMEFQLEASNRDIDFAQVCREHGKDPNGMRNNLQALKVKHRQN